MSHSKSHKNIFLDLIPTLDTRSKWEKWEILRCTLVGPAQMWPDVEDPEDLESWNLDKMKIKLIFPNYKSSDFWKFSPQTSLTKYKNAFFWQFLDFAGPLRGKKWRFQKSPNIVWKSLFLCPYWPNFRFPSPLESSNLAILFYVSSGVAGPTRVHPSILAMKSKILKTL